MYIIVEQCDCKCKAFFLCTSRYFATGSSYSALQYDFRVTSKQIQMYGLYNATGHWNCDIAYSDLLYSAQHHPCKIFSYGLQLFDREDRRHKIIPGTWHSGVHMHDMGQVLHMNKTNKIASAQQLYLKHYYNNAGAVNWQNKMCDWW